MYISTDNNEDASQEPLHKVWLTIRGVSTAAYKENTSHVTVSSENVKTHCV